MSRALQARSRPATACPAPKAMIVAGVMSGTSADGVDVAFCRISPGLRGGLPRLKLLGHRAFPYAPELREAVLAAMHGGSDSSAKPGATGTPPSTAALAQLNWRLGEVYADCVAQTAQRLGLQPQLIACHGQTVYHQATRVDYLQQPMRCTWQLGEASVIAERLHVPVVSDFRPADMAAGGQGAPLVPILDLCLFRHAKKNRLLLNLGGIANVTALPAGCGAAGVLAFDTGPANMVIDACMTRMFGKAFDCGGGVAGRGRVLAEVVAAQLLDPYFVAPPPKSCGREQFGAAFAERFIAACEQAGGSKRDVIATATAFTVESILDAHHRFCWPHFGQRAPLARATELFAAGGGARNAALMRQLRERFAELGVSVRTTEDAGLPVEAKEAAAFALLGWLTWHGLPGNLPSATGANRPVVLGRITHG